MSLRFDWYPNYQHEVIISQSDLIVDSSPQLSTLHQARQNAPVGSTPSPLLPDVCSSFVALT